MASRVASRSTRSASVDVGLGAERGVGRCGGRGRAHPSRGPRSRGHAHGWWGSLPDAPDGSVRRSRRAFATTGVRGSAGRRTTGAGPGAAPGGTCPDGRVRFPPRERRGSDAAHLLSEASDDDVGGRCTWLVSGSSRWRRPSVARRSGCRSRCTARSWRGARRAYTLDDNTSAFRELQFAPHVADLAARAVAGDDDHGAGPRDPDHDLADRGAGGEPRGRGRRRPGRRLARDRDGPLVVRQPVRSRT